ncbi:MAG: insulinase family protein [Muribaculaceae bacterium]|nr:insulinase family protein [Muribaculaceae bacterium]
MINYTLHTLPNGLRVVWHPVESVSMAAVNIIYNVGARDEHPDRTGLAHLFEHLMFGGSANVPDFDAAVEHASGVNNAWTSNDFTNFYDILPAVNLETAFWVESDRMLSPALSDRAIDVQRSVVIEEFKQVCLNQPFGDLAHHLRSLLYTTHPYRYPTLGITPDHVAAVSAEDVREFFRTHYAPNNAVLVVSGNVGEDRVMQLAEKYFADIPRRDIAPRLYAPEPEITAPRYKEVSGNVPHVSLTVAFPMAAYMQPGYMECDKLSDVLANGRSARLLQDVVMKGDVITQADASIAGSDEAGFFMVNARLSENTDSAIERARMLIREQLDRLADSCVTELELARCNGRYESTFAFGNMGYAECATNLASAVMQNQDINTQVDRYRVVTAESMRQTAQSVFDRNRECTLVYRPRL